MKGCVLKINICLLLHLGHSLMIFISLFSPVPPALFCCSKPASRGWTESGVHHSSGPSWGNSLFLRLPRWVSAAGHSCWHLISCWCSWLVWMALAQKGLWQIFPQWGYQQNLPSNTQLLVFLEAIGIDCLQVLWMCAELGQNWTESGFEAVWEEWDSHTHVHYICVKVLFSELFQPIFLGFILSAAYFFLAVYYLQLLFHHKAVTLVLQLNSKRPLFVWSCCSEEHSSQWLTAVSCTKHSC